MLAGKRGRSDAALQTPQFRVLVGRTHVPAGVAFNVHPNVDKKAWANDGAIMSKSADKPFPVGAEVNVLKWRYQATDDSAIPFTSAGGRGVVFFRG